MSSFDLKQQAINRDTKRVIIFSHSLDGYEFMPLSVKKDFGISKLRSWFLKVDDSKPALFAGVRFSRFMDLIGDVQGYFCPAQSLLMSGDLDSLTLEEIRGTMIIQLLPDFHAYKSQARVLGELLNLDKLKAISLYPDEAIAQMLAEEGAINMIGFCLGLSSLRNNPFASVKFGDSFVDTIQRHNLLNDLDKMWSFLSEIGVSYGMVRSGLSFVNFSGAHASALSDPKFGFSKKGGRND